MRQKAAAVFVIIRWDRKDGLAVPLSQLKPIGDTDERSKQAVGDWHYWVRMGYEFWGPGILRSVLVAGADTCRDRSKR